MIKIPTKNSGKNVKMGVTKSSSIVLHSSLALYEILRCFENRNTLSLWSIINGNQAKPPPKTPLVHGY